MSKISILIPSRYERFLQKTVSDLLTKAAGEVEILIALDGYWPDPPLADHPRVRILHVGQAIGMRPCLNALARVASGDFLMKLDGHCMVADGFDETLQADCDDDWIVVPRRYSLDPENWAIQKNGKAPVDAHFLSYPFERPGDRTCGLHGQVWNARARERQEIPIDDEMSSQGSCWFMSRQHWDRLGEMEVHRYGTFAQEFQELGNKTWLGGGRVVVNKKTWYGHLHKGRTYGTGYQFSMARWESWAREREEARAFCIDWWLNDRWTARVRDFGWLVEKFWPVPTWPDDWERRLPEKQRLTCEGMSA